MIVQRSEELTVKLTKKMETWSLSPEKNLLFLFDVYEKDELGETQTMRSIYIKSRPQQPRIERKKDFLWKERRSKAQL